MPTSKGQERGIRTPLNLRVGLDVPSFKGMNLQGGDAGSLDDDQFQPLENVRLGVVTPIRPRPGLTKKNLTPLTGCVIGIWDDRIPEP